MAKGMPSSRAHTCATAAELSADSSKPGLAALARAANSMPASDAATAAAEPSAGSPSGGTGKTSSPGTSRRSLPVARNRTPRHWATSVATRPAAPFRTCSQLSSTTSSSRSASARTSPAVGVGISRSDTPSACATLAGTRAGSVSGASSTSRAPSPKPASASAATRSASRVLPHPPAPVSVTTLAARRRSSTAAISGPRPTSASTSAGSPDCRGGIRDIYAPPSSLLGRQPRRMPRLAASYDLAGGDIPPSADASGNGNREPFLIGTPPSGRTR